MKRIAPILVAAMLAMLVPACGTSGEPQAAGVEQPTYSYVIEAGASDSLERGETVEILPREMLVKVGETIQIVNEDDEPHILGQWVLGPHETLRQRFVSPGVFEGSCSVHPSGQLRLIVSKA